MVRKTTKKRKAIGKAIGRKKSTGRGRAKSSSRSLKGTSNIEGVAMMMLGAGAGAGSGRLLNTLAVKFDPSIANQPLLSGIGQLAVGFALYMFSKNNFVKDMAIGLGAEGLMVATVATGIISGPGNIPRRGGYHVMRGGNFNVVSGPKKNLALLNGGNFDVVSGPTNRGNLGNVF